ncbi:hypothetical protein BDN67DRAFT_985862 [Paxillus ammoniavirescens]|nr:hypothetical protein BDN67DRAFT_985862 [Paxillus ammoniavirescens]
MDNAPFLLISPRLISVFLCVGVGVVIVIVMAGCIACMGMAATVLHMVWSLVGDVRSVEEYLPMNANLFKFMPILSIRKFTTSHFHGQLKGPQRQRDDAHSHKTTCLDNSE